jgi:dethiobiotin synthetase
MRGVFVTGTDTEVGKTVVAAAIVAAATAKGMSIAAVPLAKEYLVRDFAGELGLPVVIAARPGLGTISHTLLTIEAARAVALRIQAVVLTPWPDDPEPIHRSNMETIERFGEVPVIGLPTTTPATLADAGAVLPVSDWLSP